MKTIYNLQVVRCIGKITNVRLLMTRTFCTCVPCHAMVLTTTGTLIFFVNSSARLSVILFIP